MSTRGILCLASLLLVQIVCTNTSFDVAGGSSEVGNPSVVTGLVTGTDALPIVNASVALVPRDYNPVTDAPLSDSMRDSTDATGAYSVLLLDSAGMYNLQVMHGPSASGILIPVVIVASETLEVAAERLQPLYNMHAVIPAGTLREDAYAFLAGTTLSVPLSQSEDTITILAPIGIEEPLHYVNRLEPTASVSFGVPSLLVDDFDESTGYSSLHQITGGSFWFTYNDTGDGGNSIIEPVGIMEDITLGYSTIGAYSGNSLGLRFTLTSMIESPFANLGLELRSAPNEWSDLSSMTGLSFYAKGSGSIRVFFVTKRVLDYPAGQNMGHPGVTVALEADWQKIEFSLGEIDFPEWSVQATDGLTWEECRDSVDLIIFGADGGPGAAVELQLDEVVLHGMIAKDFIE